MKKLISIVLVLVMITALCVPAFAVDVTESGSTNANLSYTVASSYTVTIPDNTTENPITVTPNDAFANLGAPVTLAAGALLNVGQTLTVKLYSATATEDENFNLSLTGDAATKVAYSIQKSDATAVAAKSTAGAATTILSVAAGAQTEVNVQLQYQITGSPAKSGVYTDTLTFVVAVA